MATVWEYSHPDSWTLTRGVICINQIPVSGHGHASMGRELLLWLWSLLLHANPQQMESQILLNNNVGGDLTHWGRVTHICVSKLIIIGSDNGLSPSRRQAIIWTNADILLIGPLGTNFSEILIEIYTFSFIRMHLKMSSGKWRPSCLGFNALTLTVLWPEYFVGMDNVMAVDSLGPLLLTWFNFNPSMDK